jgi:hypothetical protein
MGMKLEYTDGKRLTFSTPPDPNGYKERWWIF